MARISDLALHSVPPHLRRDRSGVDQNPSWQAVGTGHVERHEIPGAGNACRPNEDAARGEGPADPLRSILRWILHAQVPARPQPARRGISAAEE